MQVSKWDTDWRWGGLKFQKKIDMISDVLFRPQTISQNGVDYISLSISWISFP